MSIKLTNCAIYYKGKDHQVKALDYLESNIPPEILAKFENMWRASPAEPVAAIIQKSYLRLVKTAARDKHNCVILNLQYFKNGILQDSINCCSGARGRQTFRTGADSESGSFEPLPEGKWHLSDLLWADGKDNYRGAIHMAGLGPVTVLLDYVAPGKTRRRNIEIHIDWNREAGSPGTAGCVGLYSVENYQKLVSWLRDSDPRDLYVDWNLGTCPKPI